MASKKNSTVLISGGFVTCQQEINKRFKTDDVVELRAKGSYIEMAIQLAEDCIKKGWAQYDRFLSGLASEEGKDVPEVSIKLRYVPAPQAPSEETQPPKRKEYRQRENQATDKPKERRRGEERKGSGEGKGYY